MKLVAGLGNPGPRYRGTYHNIGFDVVDEIARRAGVAFGASPADALAAKVTVGVEPAWLVKPLTFMNLSGQAVGALARYYRLDPADVLVVVDDVALETGRLRIRRGGSAGGHNGLKSVIEHLGTEGFPRVRVGVGRGDARRDLADHVLAKIGADDRARLEEAVARAADAVECVIAEGTDAAMNRYNRDPGAEAPDVP
ncbi:MAG: aminoacyl-tRNA hydrolase [Vicinamibacteraceae bacterium]|nr:aminoacyl-tRNA hydrolase [Vicinamibacteraceae bacterium]